MENHLDKHDDFFYDSPLAARLYDLQHAGDPALDAEYRLLLDLMRRAGGPILELGCGTGRILLPALANGMDICGMDRSGAFLARLVEKARAMHIDARPRVWRADLQRPGAGPRRFALAFAAFRTFDHLVERDARRRFLIAARYFIRPGGRLILNLINPDPHVLAHADTQLSLVRDDLRDPISRRRVQWWSASRIDRRTHRITETSQYQFMDSRGRIVDECRYYIAVRWTPRREMESLARRTAWRIEHCWGGFHREPYADGSGDAVWVLRR